MKTSFGLLGVFLLTVASLAVDAATAPAAPTAPTVSQEESLRARVKSYNEALVREDYDTAIRYINPDLVELVGRDEMKKKLKEIMGAIIGLNALVDRKLTGCSIRKVTIEKDGTNATVQLFFYSVDRKGGGNRKQFPGEQKWVLVDKAWYWMK